MFKVKFFPGDVAIISGAEVTVDHIVTLSSETPIERITTPGLTDLPETELSIGDLWVRHGHRPPMTFRHDLRCPCGSASVRQSDTHVSCQKCQRVWENSNVLTTES